MTLKLSLSKKHLFSLFVIFSATLLKSVPDVAVNQIINLIDVLQSIKAASPSQNTSILTSPATPIAATSPLQWLDAPGFGSLPGDWPAVATSNAGLGSWPVARIQNNKSVSCAQGLQTLYVDLMNKNGTGILSCQFTIKGNATLTALAQQGMYIAVQVSNVNVSAGTSVITVLLTDQTGNVFAQAAANLASKVGATYVCAGFNTNPFYGELVTPSTPATQTCVNLVKISDSSRIWYQDQGAATTVTTSLLGGTTVPTNTSTLIPPKPFIAASSQFGTWGTTPTDGFIATGNTLAADMTTLVDKRQKGIALACKGGLQTINVGLSGSKGQGGWGCTFTITGILQQLAEQGLFVVVTTLNHAGANMAIASLTDVSGNVFATTAMTLSAGQGFSFVNIGYNMSDSMDTPTATQVSANWIPLTANTPIASWYQDQGAATTTSTASIGLS